MNAADERPRRSYVKKDAARLLLIDAALELLRSRPFPQVTTKEIAAAAHLTPMAIQTHFGGQKGLYQAVSDELLRRVLERSTALVPQAPTTGADDTATAPHTEFPLLALVDPDLVLRSQLVAWLLGEGVDPLHFMPDTAIKEAMVAHLLQEGASEAVASAFASMVAFLLSGFSVFSPSRPIPPEEFALTVELIQHLRSQLPAISLDRDTAT